MIHDTNHCTLLPSQVGRAVAIFRYGREIRAGERSLERKRESSKSIAVVFKRFIGVCWYAAANSLCWCRHNSFLQVGLLHMQWLQQTPSSSASEGDCPSAHSVLARLSATEWIDVYRQHYGSSIPHRENHCASAPQDALAAVEVLCRAQRVIEVHSDSPSLSQLLHPSRKERKKGSSTAATKDRKAGNALNNKEESSFLLPLAQYKATTHLLLLRWRKTANQL